MNKENFEIFIILHHLFPTSLCHKIVNIKIHFDIIDLLKYIEKESNIIIQHEIHNHSILQLLETMYDELYNLEIMTTKFEILCDNIEKQKKQLYSNKYIRDKEKRLNQYLKRHNFEINYFLNNCKNSYYCDCKQCNCNKCNYDNIDLNLLVNSHKHNKGCSCIKYLTFIKELI